jgi:hypothetical protein
MTLTLAPRPTDRKGTAKKHSGAYYGWQLKRVIEKPPKVSWIDRLTTWWEDLTPVQAAFLLGIIVAAVGLAWVIVS